MTDKNELLQNYRNKINKIICNTDLEVDVRITHGDTNICFNCNQREILYAIQSCLRKNDYLFSSIRENVFGIALLVPINDIRIDTLCLDRFFVGSFFFGTILYAFSVRANWRDFGLGFW